MFQSNVGPPIFIKLVEQLENSGQLEETGVPQLNMLFHGMIKKSKKMKSVVKLFSGQIQEIFPNQFPLFDLK